MFLKSSLNKVFVALALSATLAACSSPAEDSEVREEPNVQADAQSDVEMEAIGIDKAGTDVHTDVTHAPTVDTSVNNTSHSSATASTDPMTDSAIHTEVEGADDVADVATGTHNDADVIDGTNEEEHVSTY